MEFSVVSLVIQRDIEQKPFGIPFVGIYSSKIRRIKIMEFQLLCSKFSVGNNSLGPTCENLLRYR